MSKLNCSNCKYYDFNACDGVDWCKLNHEETGICGNCDREFEDLEEATTHYDALVEENNTFLTENSKMAGKIKDLQSQLAEKENSVVLKPDKYVIVTNGWKKQGYGIARVHQEVQDVYYYCSNNRIGSFSPMTQYGEFKTIEEAQAKLKEVKRKGGR